MPNPKELFLQVVGAKLIHAKWDGKPHQAFKSLGNTSKGDAGQEFITKYAQELGFRAENFGRTGDLDVKIGDKDFEVKLASEDTSGCFQFNHIRLDYKYDFILCLGVAPDELFFRIWSKADIATNKAGNLVSMGRGQNASFKLTKRKSELLDILLLQEELRKIV